MSRRRALPVIGLLVATSLAVSLTYRGWGPEDPTWRAGLDYPNLGEYQTLDPGELTPAATCGGCHTQHYAEWAESGMGKSSELSYFLIDLYRTSLDLRGAPDEGVAQCLHCHAPAAVMGSEPDLDMALEISQEGVTCDICHTAAQAWANDAPGMIHWDPSGPKRGPLYGTRDIAVPDGEILAVSPFHETVKSDLHSGSSELCGACHMSLWPTNALPIDWTYAEWKRSPWAEEGVGCPQCHMTPYEGQATADSPVRTLHRHTFPGGGQEAFVQSAAEISLESVRHFAGHEVVATVENTRAGHSFPTGNATAPVVSLRLTATDARGEVVFEDQRDYRLVYVDKDGDVTTDPTVAFKVAQDTTLQPREPEHEHFFIANHLGAADVTAELVYQRWSEEVVDNHAALVGEFFGRYLKEGVRLHRLPAHFDKLDPEVLDRVRSHPTTNVDKAAVSRAPRRRVPCDDCPL